MWTLEVDIITLEMGSRLPFYIKHGPVELAIERGVYFEICYAPAIRDSASRRQLYIQRAELVRVTVEKYNNYQRSTKAMNYVDHMISLTCELFWVYHVLVMYTKIYDSYRETRRNTHRAVVSFEPISSLKPNELWKQDDEEEEENEAEISQDMEI
ncbi:ribonuclease P protein subunit p30-like [Rhizophagus clarus]|uniref:Ribonuclease P protein subunit p30-like n=1 Tax=Rhizophagus clarus TaxID=94130 RepID=A0A8H3MKD6_9GLOM|nr:ribonuclease P protein subunit p30-like [Rhizophagus clarus]